MKLEPDRPVKVEVTHTECERTKLGDVFYFNGPFLNCETSCSICVTALVSIYPWIMTARYGIESDNLGWKDGYRIWCPEKSVEFLISPYDG